MKRMISGAAAVVALAGCSAATSPATSAPGSGATRHTASSTGQGSSASPGSSAPHSPRATPKPNRIATVTVSGDLLWHDTVYMSAQGDAQRAGSSAEFDFGPMFSGIRDILTGADVSLCHEEVPVAPPGRPYSNYPVFAAPPATAQGIKSAGFKACTTASNHSWDQGFAGIKATLDALDANGIAHTGTARDQAEADKPLIIPLANGLKLGVVEGAYGLNGFELPADQKFAWTPWDADTLLKKARQARQAGADIVMVGMHGGTEYSHEANEEQLDLATKLTASPDVDLVYGHHAHVVQPWTKINGKWVAFGMGNLVAQMLPQQVDGYEGIIARFTFKVAGDGTVSVDQAEYIPVYWNYNGTSSAPIRIVPVKKALADPSRTDHVRLQQAEERTRTTVLSMGVQGAVEA